MSFTRTNYGLSNLHLFHSVDKVVYIEGGETSYSYIDVYQGKSGDTSPDIIYWQAIFRCMVPKIHVCFKPVGSKGTLQRLAQDITSGSISNVFVAMDQDLDRFDGTKILGEGVFYTWGYSWETDLFHKKVLEECIFMLCPIDRSSNETKVQADIAREFHSFERSVRWFVKADVLLSLCNGGLFNRKDWKKYVKARSGQHGEPYIETSTLRTEIHSRNASRSIKPIRGTGHSVNTVRDCYGHIVGTYCFRCLMHLLSKYSGSPTLSMSTACSLFVKTLSDMIQNREARDVIQHHEIQFAFLSS